MLLIQNTPFRRRRAHVPPRPVLLAGASYETGISITLTFNQPVNSSAVAVNSFTLNDGAAGRLYVGDVPAQVDPLTVRITLMYITNIPAGGVTLDVDGDNGIKAVGSAAAWAGVSGLALPFP